MVSCFVRDEALAKIMLSGKASRGRCLCWRDETRYRKCTQCGVVRWIDEVNWRRGGYLAPSMVELESTKELIKRVNLGLDSEIYV